MKSGGPILNPRRNRWILARLYLTRRLFWLEKNRVEGKILLTLLLSLSLSRFFFFSQKESNMRFARIGNEKCPRYDRMRYSETDIANNNWYQRLVSNRATQWKRQEMNYFPQRRVVTNDSYVLTFFPRSLVIIIPNDCAQLLAIGNSV